MWPTTTPLCILAVITAIITSGADAFAVCPSSARLHTSNGPLSSRARATATTPNARPRVMIKPLEAGAVVDQIPQERMNKARAAFADNVDELRAMVSKLKGSSFDSGESSNDSAPVVEVEKKQEEAPQAPQAAAAPKKTANKEQGSERASQPEMSSSPVSSPPSSALPAVGATEWKEEDNITAVSNHAQAGLGSRATSSIRNPKMFDRRKSIYAAPTFEEYIRMRKQ